MLSWGLHAHCARERERTQGRGYTAYRILWLSPCNKYWILWLFSQFLIPNAVPAVLIALWQLLPYDYFFGLFPEVVTISDNQCTNMTTSYPACESLLCYVLELASSWMSKLRENGPELSPISDLKDKAQKYSNLQQLLEPFLCVPRPQSVYV